jgi:hypothetical protein
VARWARLYADHKAVSGGVTYVHLAGILLGGGLAVSADRTVLRWSPQPDPDRPRELQTLAAVHRWVLAGLGLTLVSGIGMLLADLDTYVASVVFWTKMSLIVLLVGNGFLKLRAEAALTQHPGAALHRLRGTAVASVVLWFATLLAGTVLAAVS